MITCCALSYFEDQLYLLSGSEDKSLKQWNVHTGDVRKTFEGHESSVTCCALSHPEKGFQDKSGKDVYLFSGSSDKTIKQWDIESGELCETFEGHMDGIT